MRRRKEHQHLFESLEEQTMETEESNFMPRQFADWREIPSESDGPITKPSGGSQKSKIRTFRLDSLKKQREHLVL
jgi:hypothetical protein